MDIKTFVKSYFSSSLGLVNAIIPLSTLLLMRYMHISWPISIGAALVDGGLFFIVMAGSGRAAKAAVEEKDRLVGISYRSRLDALLADAEKISVLRFDAPEIVKMRDAAVLYARTYAEAAGKAQTWSPKAGEAFSDICELFDIYQKGRDSLSTENRFGLESGNDEEGFRQRILNNLREKTVLIGEEYALLGSGPTLDRLEIMENLK
jgi:hypothetical protein